jgi:hypothetical protein
MKASEFKLSVVTGLNNLIDDYFGTNSVSDKFMNSTLKILVKQNTYKLDGILSMFADERGMIDENIILEEYSKVIGDSGFILDIRDFVKNDLVRNLLPNKALVIKREDLRKMLNPSNEHPTNIF